VRGWAFQSFAALFRAGVCLSAFLGANSPHTHTKTAHKPPSLPAHFPSSAVEQQAMSNYDTEEGYFVKPILRWLGYKVYTLGGYAIRYGDLALQSLGKLLPFEDSRINVRLYFFMHLFVVWFRETGKHERMRSSSDLGLVCRMIHHPPTN
jgi:hypothetical protein